MYVITFFLMFAAHYRSLAQEVQPEDEEPSAAAREEDALRQLLPLQDPAFHLPPEVLLELRARAIANAIANAPDGAPIGHTSQTENLDDVVQNLYRFVHETPEEPVNLANARQAVKRANVGKSINDETTLNLVAGNWTDVCELVCVLTQRN